MTETPLSPYEKKMPEDVKTGVILLSIVTLIATLGTAWTIYDGGEINGVKITGGLALFMVVCQLLQAFVIFKIAMGRRWARTTMMVLFFMSGYKQVGEVVRLMKEDVVTGIFLLTLFLMFLAGLAWLHSVSANLYFSKK